MNPSSAPSATTSADQAIDHLEGVAISEGQALKTPADQPLDAAREHMYPLPQRALDALQTMEGRLAPATRNVWHTISSYVRAHPKRAVGLGLLATVLGVLWARGKAH